MKEVKKEVKKKKSNQPKGETKKTIKKTTIDKQVTGPDLEKIGYKKEKKKQEKKTAVNKKVKGPNLEKIEYKKERKEVPKNKNNKKLIFLIIILTILIIIFIGMHFISPMIILNGKSEIELSYNEEYIEQGATAKYLKKDITSKIKTTNNIDTSKIGNYEVVYTLKHKGYEIKKTRTVKVVDKIAPIITLEGETEVNICPGSSFKEIGYKAEDEYDKDLTDKVVVETKKDKVIYTVKDNSGNSYSISRKINEKDVTKPVITLKGNKTMYLSLEDDFTEPGYTAADNCTKDLTNKVVITGSVKAKQRGTYTLNYEVKDNSGNKTTIQRKVIISEKTNPNSGTIKKGTIYLTFDDGPSSIITGSILDILKEEGVKATFFVTNNGPDYLIKRIYDEGHTIALHTASHNYANIYSSTDNYFKDLELVSNRVKRITGQTSKIVRFPGGSSNTISRRYSKGIMTTLSNELFSRGYRYYDWNIDSGDASTSKTKEAVYNKVVNNLSKNKANMVLMHDIKYQTRDALSDIIKYGKENGYIFDRIDMDTYMIRQKINN